MANQASTACGLNLEPTVETSTPPFGMEGIWAMGCICARGIGEGGRRTQMASCSRWQIAYGRSQMANSREAIGSGAFTWWLSLPRLTVPGSFSPIPWNFPLWHCPSYRAAHAQIPPSAFALCSAGCAVWLLAFPQGAAAAIGAPLSRGFAIAAVHRPAGNCGRGR